MVKENKINYFRFIGALLAGIIIPHILNIPDIDQNILSPLGHRSIITHSILFPYLMHYFLINKKDNPNPDFIIFIIGFYLSVAMHLSADLYPKGWRGTAFIKLPGNSSIGEGPSIIWMFLNVLVATYFSAILLKRIANIKKYWITYLIIGSGIGLVYAAVDEGEVGQNF